MNLLKRSFLFNLLLASLVVVGLLVLFFNSLDWLTNHNRQTTVPPVEGKNMKEAMKILKKKGFEVLVDSTYQGYKNPLEVLFQEPASGSTVKFGRTIFLTVNRQTPPSIAMPNLVGKSFRNALLTMQSYRLIMGDTIYRPDLATGSVLEQQWKGKILSPGTMVPIGSRIDLVIAEGFSGAIEVPNLVGLSWKEARTILDSLIITPNAVWEGEITDSDYAIIYSQTPEPINELDFKNSINRGDLIDLRIMQNPSQELLLQNQSGSKKLLGDDEEVLTDSNEVPISSVKESSLNGSKPDTGTKKKIVPGMNIPSQKPIAPKSESKTDTKAKTDVGTKVKSSNTKTGATGVNQGADKPAKPKTDKPKTDKPKVDKPKSDKPVKPADDPIKSEYD